MLPTTVVMIRPAVLVSNASRTCGAHDRDLSLPDGQRARREQMQIEARVCLGQPGLMGEGQQRVVLCRVDEAPRLPGKELAHRVVELVVLQQRELCRRVELDHQAIRR